MPIQPAGARERKSIEAAISHLKQARDALKDAQCPNALKRVRGALTSAQGARRHVEHRVARTNP